MRVRGIKVLIAGLAACIAPAAASAQTAETEYGRDERTLRVAPVVVEADEWSDRLGLQAEAGWRRSRHDMAADFPISYDLRAEGIYLWVKESVRIPDATRLRVGAAGSISISKPPKRAPRNLPPEELLKWDGGGYNLGFLELGLTAGYEASADREEQHVTAGVEGRYAVNAVREGRLVPSLVARIEWVEPTASEARDDAGIPEDSDGHRRWGVLGYWNFPLSLFWGRLQALRLQAEASIFRASGLEEVLEDEGWQSGEYVSCTLRYSRAIRLVGPVAVTSVFGRYSAGQLPTDSTGRDAFSAGLEIGSP